jgi:uncharacterized protein (DUF1778 family)
MYNALMETKNTNISQAKTQRLEVARFNDIDDMAIRTACKKLGFTRPKFYSEAIIEKAKAVLSQEVTR